MSKLTIDEFINSAIQEGIEAAAHLVVDSNEQRMLQEQKIREHGGVQPLLGLLESQLENVDFDYVD